MRADQLLVARGHAPTRSAAQRLIEQGAVRWLGPKGWALPRKAGEDLPAECTVEVTDDAELRYASRGGLKLDGALTRCSLDATGRRCLDIGQGTGGFTDALLQRGAAAVVGIDVGHGQLHQRLQADARVEYHEGVNARDVSESSFAGLNGPSSFDLVTGDVSFISLTLVLPTAKRYLASDGDLLMLVKPQFELQAGDIGKGGIVREARHFLKVEARLRETCEALSLQVLDYLESPITGGGSGAGKGNTEFFIWARHAVEPIRTALDV
jgi:23S rRNA (cytidine1920-2'-O)/16S rRNA (cytidine1409-2'-O)-methyltransferase